MWKFIFGAAVMLPAVSHASDEATFSLTTRELVHIKCDGPLARRSDCVEVEPTYRGQEFYSASSFWYGKWQCSVFEPAQRESCSSNALRTINFCATTPYVDLTWEGSTLRVNQRQQCSLTMAASVLGQDGEDSTPGSDIDSFDFAGRPGEQVEIKLDVNGSAGGMGEVATLRVVGQAGANLAEKTGKLPFKLSSTLDGQTSFVVERAKPSDGTPFRGYYVLNVKTTQGRIGERLLKPHENVEQ